MSVAAGKAKYADAAATAVAKYNSMKGTMANRWAEGLTSKAGVTPGPLSRAAYERGIARGTYHMGDPNLWERNFREGIAR